MNLKASFVVIVFLLMIQTLFAATAEAPMIGDHTGEIKKLLEENGCQTNDMWQRNGQCFRIFEPNDPTCWLCYDCWGPFCDGPFYAGCRGAP